MLFRSVSQSRYTQEEFGTDDQMMREINRVLDSGRPAGVSLCAEALRGGNGIHHPFRGYSPPLKRGSNANVIQCSSHAVLATAKRLQNGTCQVLIRNSWGSDWRPEGLSCACKTPTRYFPDCPRVSELPNHVPAGSKLSDVSRDFDRRVYVGCWISQSKLAPNVKDVGSIR